MKRVGLDLSTVSTGYSVFEDGRLVESGKIVPPDSDAMSRIFHVVDSLKAVVRTHCPREVFIEDVYYGNNYLTTKVLNRLGGAVAYMLHDMERERYAGSLVVTYVTATAVRKAIGLLPKSTKSHVIDAVNAKFGLSLGPKDDDEADAVVLGHYGFWRDTHPEESFGKSVSDFNRAGVKTPRIGRGKRNGKRKA